MNRRFVTLGAFCFLLVSLCQAAPDSATPEPRSPAEDGTLPALTAIAGQGMMDSHAYDYLEELSDDIGGRVTVSPQAAQAIEWAWGRCAPSAWRTSMPRNGSSRTAGRAFPPTRKSFRRSVIG